MKKASSKKLLLDVNVLLALAWPNHQFHTSAKRRMESSDEYWATCALTELAFIRLSANSAVIGSRIAPSEAASLLAEMVCDSKHFFVNAMPSPVSKSRLADFDRVLGAKQLTDLYLLRLAAKSAACFLTFDTRLEEISRGMCEVEVLGYLN